MAALVKAGGWASHVLVGAQDAAEVPEKLGAAEAETVVVNGITAWQMLHRTSRVRAGQRVLVHGAGGGGALILVQLARAAGVQVIGTASARDYDALRELDVTPVGCRTGNVPAQVRELAPGGSGRRLELRAPPTETRPAPRNPCRRWSSVPGGRR